jgi:hypothetical protein
VTITTDRDAGGALRLVTIDLYRDIHKAIRTELLSLTEEAGSLDPGERADRLELAGHVRGVVDLLVTHAQHEDDHVQPAVEEHLPLLAEEIEGDHERLEARLMDLAAWADAGIDVSAVDARAHQHRLYLDLASFTSAYLQHQDLEERLVMPALEDAIGVEAVAGIHMAIIASIPPEEMARSLALMLPAMNIDDRTELLGGMRANAPAEAFQGVWSLAGSVLRPSDHAALGTRLGLA